MQQIESKKPLIHILLADRHKIVRNGICQELKQQTDMRVIGETSDGYEVLDLVKLNQPDIVILDIKLAGLNGVNVTRYLSTMTMSPKMDNPDYQPPAVFVYSAHDDKQYIWSLLAAGAQGYLLKSEPLEQLLVGIRQIASGYTFLSRAIQTRMVEAIPYLHHDLSAGEIKIMQLLAHGLSNKEIAQRLHISEGTVKTHLNHTYRKVPWIRSRAEAVSWAWINRVVSE